MTPNPERLVVVEWEDAWAVPGWTDGTAHEGAVVHTVGWVLLEDERGIRLAQSWDGTGAGSEWFIPNGMINWVKQLTVGGPA